MRATRSAVVANRSFVEQVLAGRAALGTRFRYPLATGRTPFAGGSPTEIIDRKLDWLTETT